MQLGGVAVKGIQFVVNERGQKTAVVIDLKDTDCSGAVRSSTAYVVSTLA